MKLTLEIRARPGKLLELEQTLQDLLPTIREGNTGHDCRLYRDLEQGEVLVLTAGWPTQAGLERHLRSESGSALLGAIDLLGETASVALDRGPATTGVESLRRMRQTARREQPERSLPLAGPPNTTKSNFKKGVKR